MKIIKKDNYDRENVSDVLICENCKDYYANLIADMLNKSSGDHGPDFYKAVPDDYKLYQLSP